MLFYAKILNMLQTLPRKDYSLLILDIPYGFRLAGSITDEEPFKYNQIEKIANNFASLTMTPLWRIVVFYSRDLTYSVSKAVKTTCHALEGLTW